MFLPPLMIGVGKQNPMTTLYVTKATLTIAFELVNLKQAFRYDAYYDFHILKATPLGKED